MRATSFVLRLALLTALVSCGGDDWELAPGSPDDPRADALRRRLDVTVALGTAQALPAGCAVSGTSATCPADALALAVYAGCVQPNWNGGACEVGARNAHRHLCVAEALMRAAQTVTSESLAVTGNGETLNVLPPDTESQVELARVARNSAFEAATEALNRLTNSACTETLLSSSAAPAAQPAGQIRQGQHLASFVREAEQLIVESTTFMAERAAAVSDAQGSRATDRAEAEVNELAAFASRAATAHTILGGEHGLNALRTVGGVNGEGFSPQGSLSAAGARALDQYRAAAISPSRIADTTSFDVDAIVYGGGANFCHSVRARVALMSGRIELLEASSPAAYYDLVAIPRDAFVEAREYLFHEQRAFDRSATHPLPVESLADGQGTDDILLPPGDYSEAGSGCSFELFASTRNPPHQPPPVFWTALLRYDSTPQSLSLSSLPASSTGPQWFWGVSPSTPNARLLPAGSTYGVENTTGGVGVLPAAVATGQPNTNGFTQLAMLSSIADRSQRAIDRLRALPAPREGAVLAEETLGAVLGDIGRGRLGDTSSLGIAGRSRACVLGKDVQTATIRVDIDVPEVTAADLILVTRHESLDCAVYGTIERSNCLPSHIDVPTTTWTSSSVAPGALTASIDVPLSLWGASGPAADVQTVYVLRRRPGIVGNQPGGFVEITGWALAKPTATSSPTYLFCDSLPISPGTFRWGAEQIMPSETNAAMQATTCAGMNIDSFRMPLENELTDDLDGRESSWSHYLRLAQAASQQSDALAETLIDEGLQMDLRAEAAVDAIEQICGVRIDVSPTERIPSSLPLTMGGGCPDGYFRADAAATSCSLDPVAWAIENAARDSDAAALARCLGTSVTDSLETSFVGVGDTPLCLWRLTSDESSICQQEEGGPHRPCPFLAAEGEVPCASGDMPVGATPIYVDRDRLLHLFHVPPEPVPVPPSPSDLPCAALAQLRADRGALTAEQAYQYISSAFLTSGMFRNYVRNLRWEATAGDYSRVYLGNSVIASTGNPNLSEMRWPAGAAPLPWLCPADSPGFVRPTWMTANAARIGLRFYSGPLFCIQDQGENMASSEVSGLDENNQRWLRASVNDLLARAVIAAHVVTGESLEGSRIPYYAPDIDCEADPDHVRVTTRDGGGNEIGLASLYGQIGSSSSLVFESAEGTLHLDHFGDADTDGDPYELDDLDAVAQHVSGRAEWTLSPYDGDARLIFQDTDPSVLPIPDNRDVPMLAVTLGDEDVTGLGSDRAVSRLWGEFPGEPRLSSFMGRAFQSLFAGVAPPAMSRTRLTSFASSSSAIDVSELTNYYPVRSLDGCWHRDSTGIAPYLRNQARPGSLGVTLNDIYNGVELTCMGAQSAAPDPIAFGCDTTIEIDDERDVRGALESRHALRCLADRISDGAARSVVRGLPAGITTEILNAGGSALGTGSGDYGAQVAIIRSSLLEMQNEEEAVASAIRTYANALEQANNAIRSHHIGNEIADWEMASSIAQHTSNCIVAVGDQVAAIDLNGAKQAGAAIRLGAICGNGVFQSAIAVRMRDLRTEAGALEIESSLLAADTQFVQTSQAIREHAVAIRAALSRIDAAVTQLRSLQGQGRTALARALFLDDAPTGVHLAVDTVMHRRFNRTRVRYQEAHERAVRTAYIARRALEQRLAMDLSTVETPLVTVDAPSTWVDELCTLPSIDYERLRDTGDDSLASPENYVGYSVGDYVRRLEQVFESYSFAYPFQDGTDRVVLSLRDDIKRVTNDCQGPVPNLLLQSRDIAVRATESRPGWAPRGCGSAGPCVTTGPSGISLPRALGPEVSEAVLVQFGSGATASARYAQRVALERGRYRLIWWATDGVGSTTADRLPGVGAVRAVTSSGTALPILNLGGPIPTAPVDGWTRFDYFFDVATASSIDVAVLTDALGPTGRSVVVGGIQLERATGLFERDVNSPYYTGLSSAPIGVEFPPGQFYPTDETRTGTIPGCADDGTTLRAEQFVHRCEMRCTDGRSSCEETARSPICWFETSFSIDEGSLSTFVAGSPTGFARGNYNYRIESIGLNLVGTGLRQCVSGGTSGCYGSGNFSYTLVHQGDEKGNFAVRNARDESYPAPLLPGRIEGARALAAERYLTNPTSGADEALLTPYLRSEFQGRPLAGTMTLRILDEPTLAWQRLEDVQIVLNYRYWTHQR